MSFADRLLIARRHAGLTQKELADRVGVTQTAIHKIEAGRSQRSRRLIPIAIVCGVDPIWLGTGQGGMIPSASARAVAEEVKKDLNGWDAAYAVGRGARAPLYQWDELPAGDDPTLLQRREWVPVTRRVSRRAFAVQVMGDAMANEFVEGDILIVDPGVPPEHRRFVVAKLASDRSATFKQLIIDSNRRYLTPLNSRYPITELGEDADLLGVVVSKFKHF